MGDEKFTIFFERSNSRGVQLSFVDILRAKLYFNFNLNEAIDKSLQTYQFNDEDFKVDLMVRAVALRKTLLSGKSATGEIVGRSYLLTQLKVDDFIESWDYLSKLYKKTLDYLIKNNLIVNIKWIPYENMILPIIIFIDNLKDQNFENINLNQERNLIYWWWSSIFSSRYTGASLDAIATDSNLLKSLATNTLFEFPREYIYKLKIQVSDIEDVLSIKRVAGRTRVSASYSGILNLINFNCKKIPNFNGTRNTSNDQENLNDHHIYPKDFIQKSTIDDEIKDNLNSVANRMLINFKNNIEISNKSPKDYLNKYKQNNENFNHVMNDLLIDKLVLEDNDGRYFKDFLDRRAKNILDLIDRNTFSR
jgi:hypothetical protein